MDKYPKEKTPLAPREEFSQISKMSSSALRITELPGKPLYLEGKLKIGHAYSQMQGRNPGLSAKEMALS